MIMNRQNYMEKMRDTSWAPGWEAILSAFCRVYKEPCEYLPMENFQGLNSKLEGFGVYHSPNRYLHIVTRGLSRIAPHPEAYGGETSGWGFEITVKWPRDSWTRSMGAFRLLDRLSELIEIRKNGFAPMKRLWERRDPLTEAAFRQYGAGLIVLPDTEIPPADTVHGALSFFQIVNISAADAKELSAMPVRIDYLVKCMQKENPNVPFKLPSPRDYLSAGPGVAAGKDGAYVDG